MQASSFEVIRRPKPPKCSVCGKVEDVEYRLAFEYAFSLFSGGYPEDIFACEPCLTKALGLARERMR